MLPLGQTSSQRGRIGTAARQARNAKEVMGVASGKYILLAEDNEGDVFLVRESLEEQHLGFDLRVIRDGGQAIAFIDEIDKNPEYPCPQLLLLDLHLPKYDGDAILTRLRQSERCAETPVIVLSSSGSPGDQASAKRHAALHYFLKPSSLREFMELGSVVKNVLQRTTGLETPNCQGS